MFELNRYFAEDECAIVKEKYLIPKLLELLKASRVFHFD